MIRRMVIASFVAVLLITTVPAAGQRAPVIPGSKETFAVSPSPGEDRLLLYSLKRLEDGETGAYIPGPLVSLSKTGKLWRVREIKPLAADLDSGRIAWAKGRAYVVSTKGIFRLRSNGLPEKIYTGKPTGLAVSRDGATLAFWLPSSKGYILTALRVSDRRVLKQWPRPYHLGTESSGWELAFTRDGGSILARTYDEEDGNHLKIFDLHTGSMTSLLTGCNAIAQSGDDIFVFGGYAETKGLYRFSSGKLELLMHLDQEDSLTPTAHSGQVVVTNDFKKHVLIYDVTRRVAQEVDGCTDATVLKSGQQLFFLDGRIFLDAAGCQAPE